MSKQRFEDASGFCLKQIEEDAMEPIRLWRNAQIDFLRQNEPLSKEAQARYFVTHVACDFESSCPTQILFTFHRDEKLLGYGGLVHLDWTAKRAEVSFLLDPEVQIPFEEAFYAYLKLITSIAFDELKLQRLTTETFSNRPEYLRALESFGFDLEGVLYKHVLKNGRAYDSYLHALMKPLIKGALVTSASKKIPLLKAVKKIAQKVHGCDSDPNALARYFLSHFWLCPKDQDLKVASLLEYCKEHDIQLIVPTRDSELSFYASHRDRLQAAGIFVMISSPKTIEICLDKKLSSTIPSSESIDEISASLYVAKERFGAGSRHLGLKLTKSEALVHANKLHRPLFQPYIEGKEYSVDLYRTRSGAIQGIVARSRDLIVDGESQVTTTLRHPRLEALGSELAHKFDITGHAVFQVIETADATLHLLECNPRFGGASTASIAAGLDTFRWCAEEATNKPLSPFVRTPHEIRQVRFPQDKAIFLPA